MKKKQKKVQIILISIGLILILITYFYYPYMKRTAFVEKLTDKKELLDISGKDSDFENVEYQGVYDIDKIFTVKSKKAHILNKEPNIVYMTGMHVTMYLNDGRVVVITSETGKYNKSTYDCYFVSNVRATDGETKIFAENLDLLATDNSVKAYNNVIMNNPTGTLRADKVDYDFETKYFKISMFDDSLIKMKVIK